MCREGRDRYPTRVRKHKIVLTLEKWAYEPGIDAALRHELAERGLEEEDGDADEEDAREVRDQEGAWNAEQAGQSYEPLP